MSSNPLFEDLHSLIGLFYKWEQEQPDAIFLRQPYGQTWVELTYREAGQEARKMASALHSMGVGHGTHVGLLSKNCYHWILADLAIMMVGAVSVPFYANLVADQLNEVLLMSDCDYLFVGKLDEWEQKKTGIPQSIKLIRFPHYDSNARIAEGDDWNELIQTHEPFQGTPLPDLNDLWTILFTSGTTGTPKGVMHTHKNAALIARNEIIHNTLDTFSVPHTRLMSFLPLNHIAERAAIELGALMSGGSISFAESLDTFVRNLQDTQPTFFFAVPRIWTKFQLGILAKMPQKKLDRLLSIPIVSGIVKRKILKTLGLGQAKTVLTGASITPESLKQWYRKIGLNLREVYGMTENGGGFTLMPKDHHKAHTVGKPLANTELKIDPETGEILMKMPWMMTGYYKDPELTKRTLTDGWLHTGDKGQVDEDGFLSIVGRVKDAFKTSKGKFIVPTTIEKHFSQNALIEQICVAGLGIPQPVALVCLSEIGHKTERDKVSKVFDEELKRVNQILHNHERLSTIIVASEPWTDQNKLLTPTLKIKRPAIHERYGQHLSLWHESSSSVVWE